MDAHAVVSDYVRLEKRGGRLWACCPFHQEKSASFTVNPDLKTYYCFGCHKGGTIINFVMEMDKISFPEAIELLAKKSGLELAYEKSGGANFSAADEEKKKKKDQLFELYRRMSGTFHHFLLKKPEAGSVKQYIIERGISKEMIESFGLGYAPGDRYWLHSFLSGKGYSADFLAESGLFSSKDARASLFSGRLMFPIRDQQGRTSAFGGRYLPTELVSARVSNREGWEPPKYINSPELGIYRKGETLYALDLAMPEIRRTKTAYIAEGYFDVIALHQAGITNALAPLGTAFTDEQAKLLKRWVEKIVFFFDSDDAGQAAVIKGIYTCRKNGLPCAVVAKPSAQTHDEAVPPKDPADILKNSGTEALYNVAKFVISDFDYLLARARAIAPHGSSGKAQAVAFLFPYIGLMDSEVAKNSCIEAAADAFGLLPKTVEDDFNRYASGQKQDVVKTDDAKKPIGAANSPIRMNEELSLIIAVALDHVSSREGKLLSKLRAAFDISSFEDPNAREIFVVLEEFYRYGDASMDDFLARISSPELKKLIVERSVSGEFSVNTEQFIDDGMKKMRRKGLEKRQEEVILKLRSLKKSSSDETLNSEAKELLAEKMQIDEELHQLKQGRLA